MPEDYKNDSGLYFDNDKGDSKGYFSPAHPNVYNVSKTEELLSITNNLV
ncbi:hypothetical protein [Algibacter sp. L4_22]|nr:hypothetical protein [Algibacter sp. L4_22]MCL5129406.1 hypothetical protein [Algibacter sp. L4_22]